MNLKNTIPKRDDSKYKEIEEFEDFELINNALYEMGIRNNGFKKLTKMYAYCESLSNQIHKQIKWEDPLQNIQSANNISDEEEVLFSLIKKTPEENFEEALRDIGNSDKNEYNKELYDLLSGLFFWGHYITGWCILFNIKDLQNTFSILSSSSLVGSLKLSLSHSS